MAEPNFQSPMVGDEAAETKGGVASLQQESKSLQKWKFSSFFMIMLQVYDQIVIRISHETL